MAEQPFTDEPGTQRIRGAYEQGTLGLEIETQCPQLDTLLIAVGGGGLIGGIAAWFRGRIKLVSVEPVTAPTLAKAIAAGRPVDAEAGGAAAFAALLSRRYVPTQGERVGVVICGGNTTAVNFN